MFTIIFIVLCTIIATWGLNEMIEATVPRVLASENDSVLEQIERLTEMCKDDSKCIEAKRELIAMQSRRIHHQPFALASQIELEAHNYRKQVAQNKAATVELDLEIQRRKKTYDRRRGEAIVACIAQSIEAEDRIAPLQTRLEEAESVATALASENSRLERELEDYENIFWANPMNLSVLCPPKQDVDIISLGLTAALLSENLDQLYALVLEMCAAAQHNYDCRVDAIFPEMTRQQRRARLGPLSSKPILANGQAILEAIGDSDQLERLIYDEVDDGYGSDDSGYCSGPSPARSRRSKETRFRPYPSKAGSKSAIYEDEDEA